MFGKLALTFLVGFILLQTPFGAAAARCCSNTDSQHSSIDDGCCAAMGCCVISNNPAGNQLIPAPVANELSTAPAPVNLVSLIDLPIRPNESRLSQAPPAGHSPPPLALLCTFLI